MKYDKVECEKLILATPLFRLDRESESVAYRRERYMMIEHLYRYLLAVNEKGYEPYGCEIYEVAARCIDNYDSEKGPFIRYFMSAWKTEYSHIRGDDALEARYHGYRISEDDQRSLKKYFKYLGTANSSLPFSELCQMFAVKSGMTVKKSARIAMMAGVYAAENEISDSEGNATSIFDELASPEKVEAVYLASETLCETLMAVDRVFLNLQERQRAIISDMMTTRICQTIVEQRLNYSRFSFINGEIVLQYLETGTTPTQRDIACKYGRNEASISRSIKEFLRKLSEEMNH